MRIRATAWWLTRRAWGFWAVAIPACLGCYGLVRIDEWKTWIGLLANALQLLGLLVTFAGLEGDMRAFGRSLWEPVRNWWDGRPWRHVIVAATGVIGLNANAVGFVVGRAKTTGTDIDSRLEWLEQKVYKLQDDHDELVKTHREDLEKVRAEARAETQARNNAHAALEQKLKDHAVGEGHISLLGILWVTLGTVLSMFKDVLS